MTYSSAPVWIKPFGCPGGGAHLGGKAWFFGSSRRNASSWCPLLCQWNSHHAWQDWCSCQMQLHSLLGLVNYYSKFVPNLPTLLHPFNHRLKADVKWRWTPDGALACMLKHQQPCWGTTVGHSVWELKQIPIQSWHDLRPGAVLSHTFPDGPEWPVTFLIVVDTHSEWPGVITISSNTSQCTISEMRSLFSRYGLPEHTSFPHLPRWGRVACYISHCSRHTWSGQKSSPSLAIPHNVPSARCIPSSLAMVCLSNLCQTKASNLPLNNSLSSWR